MVNRSRALIAAILLLVATASACGDDPPPPPQERCGDGVSMFASGEIELDDGTTVDVELSDPEKDGEIRNNVMALIPGEIEREGEEPEPLLLKFQDNAEMLDLLDQFTNASIDGETSYDVVDTSDFDPQAVSRSDLGEFDCGPAKGTICAQVAFDSTADGVVSDDDSRVFNATGGQFTVVEVDNTPRRFVATFTLQLGPNVLASDAMSSGTIEGCVDTGYEQATDGWRLAE